MPPTSATGGIRFCGLNCSWFQPLIVFSIVSYIYIIYMGWFLLPTLQYIHLENNLIDTAFIPSSSPGFSSFINDPHATKMNISLFIFITLIFHILLILFIISYIKAIITSPGSVPVSTVSDKKKWDDGFFDISPEDDLKIEELMFDTGADLDDPTLQQWIKSLVLVERKKENGNDSNGNHNHQHLQNNGYKRHCKTCQIYKPDRAHHCKGKRKQRKSNDNISTSFMILREN